MLETPELGLELIFMRWDQKIKTIKNIYQSHAFFRCSQGVRLPNLVHVICCQININIKLRCQIECIFGGRLTSVHNHSHRPERTFDVQVRPSTPHGSRVTSNGGFSLHWRCSLSRSRVHKSKGSYNPNPNAQRLQSPAQCDWTHITMGVIWLTETTYTLEVYVNLCVTVHFCIQNRTKN